MIEDPFLVIKNDFDMSSLTNSVQLIGHLGSDPEIKKLENGGVLASVNIATNESYKNAKGEYIEQTSWHRLVGWEKIAERMGKVLKKGKEVAIRGKLVQRSYDDKNGIKRYVTEVRVFDFELFGKNPDKSVEALDVAKVVEGGRPF